MKRKEYIKARIQEAMGRKEFYEAVEKIEEQTPTKQQVKQAIGITRDKRYKSGNMTGAVKAMNKINRGLAQHPAVAKELQKQNEEVEEQFELEESSHEDPHVTVHDKDGLHTHAPLSVANRIFKTKVKHKDLHNKKHVITTSGHPGETDKLKFALSPYDFKRPKLREEVNSDDDDKHQMAQTQLYFIEYAAEEILEYIEMGGNIEEWYQNKLSKVHSDMEGLHSFIEGEKRRLGMVKES